MIVLTPMLFSRQLMLKVLLQNILLRKTILQVNIGYKFSFSPKLVFLFSCFQFLINTLKQVIFGKGDLIFTFFAEDSNENVNLMKEALSTGPTHTPSKDNSKETIVKDLPNNSSSTAGMLKKSTDISSQRLGNSKKSREKTNALPSTSREQRYKPDERTNDIPRNIIGKPQLQTDREPVSRKPNTTPEVIYNYPNPKQF